MTTTYKARKQTVGRTVFQTFEKSVNESHFKKGKHVERIIAAAEIAEEMPFVTMPLREHGILRKGERNTHLLHAFQPNLWAQDFAYGEGKLDKMTVSTAIERANASSSYSVETSPSVIQTLKRSGKGVYEFQVAMREAAMIESAYYTRLGNGEMPETSKKKIDVALMRRALRNDSMFQTIIKHAGVEETDGLALLHFSEEIDLTEILQELVRLDPYFNRRTSQVDMFTEINSTESVALKHTKTNTFIEELLVRVGRKHPSLFKKIAKTVS